MTRSGKARVGAILTVALMSLATGFLFPLMLAFALTSACSQMNAPVFHSGRTSTGGDLLTPWASEVSSARQYGYTTALKPFTAALGSGEDVEAVHRLYSPTKYDFTWARSGSTAFSAAIAQGYKDQGVNFFAAPSEILGCTQPVYSYLRNGIHRTAVGDANDAQPWNPRDGLSSESCFTCLGLKGRPRRRPLRPPTRRSPSPSCRTRRTSQATPISGCRSESPG